MILERVLDADHRIGRPDPQSAATMSRLRVRDLMTHRVVAVRPDDTLATLHELMLDYEVRHMPVVSDGGELVGLVSHRDLLRGSLIEQADVPEHLEQVVLKRVKVHEVMTENVETVAADTDLRDAAEVMFVNKYGCLPVTEGSRLVGILTESDFVRFMARGQ